MQGQVLGMGRYALVRLGGADVRTVHWQRCSTCPLRSCLTVEPMQRFNRKGAANGVERVQVYKRESQKRRCPAFMPAKQTQLSKLVSLFPPRCSAGTVYCMLLADVVLYFALLWYLDKASGEEGKGG